MSLYVVMQPNFCEIRRSAKPLKCVTSTMTKMVRSVSPVTGRLGTRHKKTVFKQVYIVGGRPVGYVPVQTVRTLLANTYGYLNKAAYVVPKSLESRILRARI